MAKPFIIGITGGSGSGKTTFIKRIRDQFSEEEVCIISQDEYYKDRSSQETDANGYQNFDLPKSIDKKAFTHDVERLLEGDVVTKVEYVFNNKDATPSVKTFRPAPIIIVEGLFVFHYRKMRDLLDLKVFFYASDHLKIIRRIRRDQVERGYPIDDVLYRYEHHVMPSYKKYIEPYMQEADLIINNNKSFDYGLEAFSSFLRERLEKAKKIAEINA
jgi:uridine kinase